MLRSTEFPRRMERLLEGAVALASERGQLCATSAPASVPWVPKLGFTSTG